MPLNPAFSLSSVPFRHVLKASSLKSFAKN